MDVEQVVMCVTVVAVEPPPRACGSALQGLVLQSGSPSGRSMRRRGGAMADGATLTTLFGKRVPLVPMDVFLVRPHFNMTIAHFGRR